MSRAKSPGKTIYLSLEEIEVLKALLAIAYHEPTLAFSVDEVERLEGAISKLTLKVDKAYKAAL